MKKLEIKFSAILIALTITTGLFAQTDEDLNTAIKAGDLNLVKKAVEAGSNVNALRKDGSAMLCDAGFWPEITQYMIDKGADVNAGKASTVGNAAYLYSYETMEVLLKAGADPNKGNSLEQTINQTNCIECIEMLIKYKADPNVKDAVGNDLIVNSVMRYMDISENFKKFGEMMTTWGYKLPNWYYERIKTGSSLEEVKVLVNAGVDVNYMNPKNGVTPLMAALGAKNTAAAKLLIEKGADVNFITPNKKDALSIAVELGDLELVKLIVDKGADVNRETWNIDKVSKQYAKGFTPLTISVVYNHVDIAKYLIEKGSKPKEGVSGYHVSAKTGCPYILTNKTAIYYAIENNNLEMVKMLVDSYNKWNMHQMEMKQPPKKNEIDMGSVTVELTYCWKIKGKYTPSLYAKKIGHKEIASFLKNKGL